MYYVLVEQVGPDQPRIHHFPGLGWPTWVDSGLTDSCCFGDELGRLSGQLLVGLLAGNPLSAGGTGVGLSKGSTPTTEFSSSTCYRLLLMGNRQFLCRVQLCSSPSLGCTTYTGKLG